jgi:hypothetical protein
MKRFILLSLSALTLSLSAVTSAQALGRGNQPFIMATNSNATDTAISPVNNTPTAVGRGIHPLATAMNSNAASTGITPFELVYRAYQGGYTAQGIRGFGALHVDFSSGRLTAKNLVQAAIDAKELAPELITNRSYLNAVELQLTGGRQ